MVTKISQQNTREHRRGGRLTWEPEESFHLLPRCRACKVQGGTPGGVSTQSAQWKDILPQPTAQVCHRRRDAPKRGGKQKTRKWNPESTDMFCCHFSQWRCETRLGTCQETNLEKLHQDSTSPHTRKWCRSVRACYQRAWLEPRVSGDAGHSSAHLQTGWRPGPPGSKQLFLLQSPKPTQATTAALEARTSPAARTSDVDLATPASSWKN